MKAKARWFGNSELNKRTSKIPNIWMADVSSELNKTNRAKLKRARAKGEKREAGMLPTLV